MPEPFIIGTRNAGGFLHAGARILKDGGSALDAVEASTRLVEDNPEDSSVGSGGIPNVLGVQEMDASVMCGKTMRAGAVGAIKGFTHPISVARKLLEEAPHVLLVAAGAENFARVMGCEEGDLETEESRKVYKAFVDDAFEHAPASARCGGYRRGRRARTGPGGGRQRHRVAAGAVPSRCDPPTSSSGPRSPSGAHR